jgi:hypothetical protein
MGGFNGSLFAEEELERFDFPVSEQEGDLQKNSASNRDLTC